ncbi:MULTISPECIES: glycerol-3-phosphate 1-O-acyltransferase PlsY [unclassified Phycicoccus]|uniref:glycerol-3-phosphate 1-O-acyltransferase PlsY n=1 Tax=unclassified Phycicoccus TaxID=2637926 RepID=UPI000A52C288|nr:MULTISPECIES: glycerol-3-phosphate 1-O-acyltransferase PlsY [unclassified Phycicoccus]
MDTLVTLGHASFWELAKVPIAAAVAFVVGAVNPATILARLLGKDLRSSGSGNPGATNAGRVLGARWGVVVGVLDVLKGLLPVLLAAHFLGAVTALVVGLAVVLGHIWSPFLKGQGGKGVATSLGAILAVEPWFGLVMVLVFVLLVWRLRWVAGASVSACLLLLALGLVSWLRWVPFGSRDTGAWCVVLALLVIYRHRRNIELWISARRDATSGDGSSSTA